MTSHLPVRRRVGAALGAIVVAATGTVLAGAPANAAVAPTVPLGTSASYSVLGASTVTNTGPSTLDGSLGLWPGTSITGFPPGLVLPPGTTQVASAAAKQAQSDLTIAYGNAAGRAVDTTTTADLGGLDLPAGVYAGPAHSALGLTGTLTLDGAGDPNSVFIFQTDSTLITASGSTVKLVNGAQACNVFWQVGSSATLGTGSAFAGNILALTSITVTTGVTVHGRALARNAAVTLDTDTFTKATCAPVVPGSETTVTGATTGTTTGATQTGVTAGTVPGGGVTTATTRSGATTTTTRVGVTRTSTPATTPALGKPPAGGQPGTPTAFTPAGPDVPGVVGPPRTGGAALRSGTSR